jgi:flagellar hook-basal body complex protein FliE
MKMIQEPAFVEIPLAVDNKKQRDLKETFGELLKTIDKIEKQVDGMKEEIIQQMKEVVEQVHGVELSFSESENSMDIGISSIEKVPEKERAKIEGLIKYTISQIIEMEDFASDSKVKATKAYEEYLIEELSETAGEKNVSFEGKQLAFYDVFTGLCFAVPEAETESDELEEWGNQEIKRMMDKMMKELNL